MLISTNFERMPLNFMVHFSTAKLLLCILCGQYKRWKKRRKHLEIFTFFFCTTTWRISWLKILEFNMRKIKSCQKWNETMICGTPRTAKQIRHHWHSFMFDIVSMYYILNENKICKKSLTYALAFSSKCKWKITSNPFYFWNSRNSVKKKNQKPNSFF